MRLFLGTFVSLIAASVLFGCASGNDAAAALRNSYAGKNLDEFVRKNGPPIREFTLNGGNKVYTFVGGQASVTIPGHTNMSVSQVGKIVTATATTTPSTNAELGCVMEVETNSAGSIVDVRMRGDTIGLWQLSRCAEITDVPKKPN